MPVPTSIYYNHDTLANFPDILGEYGVPMPCVVLCDTHTYEVAARRIEKSLGTQCLQTVNLGLKVKPLISHAEALATTAQDAASIVVVGSGTLNDIGKLAAHKLGIPYVVFATAASMNGYSSANASMLENGLKRSHAATAPNAVFADSAIIAGAPLRLTQAGLGDTLCRASVQADALLSHMLLDTWYDAACFDTMQQHEGELLPYSKHVLKGDASYAETLFRALIFSGDAMTAAKSSAPASQSEHMVAHCLELLYPRLMQNYYHGEHIAVTSLSTLRLQHYLMKQPFTLQPVQTDRRKLQGWFGEAAEDCARAMNAKDSVNIAAMQEKLAASRAQLVEEFHQFTITPEQLEAALHSAEIASWPESLNLTREEYDHALKLAYMTRDRFTFLDIAVMRKG